MDSLSVPPPSTNLAHLAQNVHRIRSFLLAPNWNTSYECECEMIESQVEAIKEAIAYSAEILDWVGSEAESTQVSAREYSESDVSNMLHLVNGLLLSRATAMNAVSEARSWVAAADQQLIAKCCHVQ